MLFRSSRRQSLRDYFFQLVRKNLSSLGAILWVMLIRYYEAPDVKELVELVVAKLDFTHIDLNGIYCFRSTGSKSRRTVARIHSLGKLWQKALNKHSAYLIEVISERFDRLNREEKEKVVIHELLHIPKGFAGGFRPHKGNITKHKIETLHQRYTTRT